VKFALMFSWHLPQVLTRFFGLTEERGSLFGRLRCGVWQSEHFAAALLPRAVA